MRVGTIRHMSYELPVTREENYFTADSEFRHLFESLVGPPIWEWIRPQLEQMGELCAKKISKLAPIVDKQSPQHIPYDERGNRIDSIVHHPAYHEIEKIIYGSGLIAMKYDPALRRRHGRRLHCVGYALGYLFGQAEGGIFCPVCMTDGAARVIDRFGSEELKKKFLPRLTAREFKDLYQGAMFLTEKQGGSDVGLNTCEARLEKGEWRLYGDKWFCSKIDAQVVLALGRPVGAPAGTKGLGLFLVPRNLDSGEHNAFTLNRIKDKLGVRSMATGEVTFHGALAYPIGDIKNGFKEMMEMVNLSRLYNAVASVSCMRRSLFEAVHYAKQRETFEEKLIDHPLMQRTLGELASQQLAALHLVFRAVEALDEADSGNEGALPLARFLIPLVKYSTAKLAVSTASECMEILGGNGYIEDYPMARILRDAQVLPIWEGSTNVVVLDCLRAAVKTQGHLALLKTAQHWIEKAPSRASDLLDRFQKEHKRAEEQFEKLSACDLSTAQWKARAACDSLYRIGSIGSLLGSGTEASLEAARWLLIRDDSPRDLSSLLSVF